jgi:hypothetical protein
MNVPMIASTLGTTAVPRGGARVEGQTGIEGRPAGRLVKTGVIDANAR